MPIRDAKCLKCDLDFESITTSLSQPDECPNCQSTEVEIKAGGYMSLYSMKGDLGSCTPSKRRYKKLHD